MLTLFEYVYLTYNNYRAYCNIPFCPFHGLCKLTKMPHRIADTHLNLCMCIFPPAIWYGKAQSIHSDRQSFGRDSALYSVGAPESFDQCDGVTSIVLLSPFSESRSREWTIASPTHTEGNPLVPNLSTFCIQ